MKFRWLVVVAMLGIMVPSGVPADDKAADNKPADDKDSNLKWIVLIGRERDHPFGSHMYQHDSMLLAKCLRETPGVQPVIYPRGWPKNDKFMDKASAVVFYTPPAGNLLLTGPHAKHAEELLKKGIGLTAIHWGTGATGPGLGEQYQKVLGGWFDTERGGGGLAVIPTRVEQIGKDHPIFRGWKEFPLRDEIYLRTKFEPDAKPLLKVKVKEGEEQVVGWVYDRPGSNDGRSFGITLGHFHENFGIEEFRRVIVNGILWTAHVDIPETGAPVEVNEQDLDIGPAPPNEKK